LAVITITLNGTILYQAGTKIYTHYFHDILPKSCIPAGIGLVPSTLYSFGVYPSTFFVICTLVLLTGLYYGYWRACSRHSSMRDPAVISATIAGTMAVFCSLNTIVWVHYFACYVYFPFLGWILWEGAQANEKWQKFIYQGAVLLFLGLDGYFIERLANIFWVCTGPIVFLSFWFNWACHVVLGPLFVLILAYRRLFMGSSQVAKRACPQGQERVLA